MGLDSGRKPDHQEHHAEKADSERKRLEHFDAQIDFAERAIALANSQVVSHRMLLLIDAQSMYLALHSWLSGRNFPIDDGLILSRFAYRQIKRTFEEVTKRVLASQKAPAKDYKTFVSGVEIVYENGHPVSGNANILKNGIYLHVIPTFELYYAPIDLARIEKQLTIYADLGSSIATELVRKVKSGAVEKGPMKRNYAAYNNFISCLKENLEFSRSAEGFFSFGVGWNGLKYFDEKAVDSQIVIRAMDSFYNKEADSVTIASSDQDYLPVHDRAAEFGVDSYHADLGKMFEGDYFGSRFRKLGERYFRGGIDPAWPLEILLEAASVPEQGRFQRYRFSEQELHALCDLHNELNKDNAQLTIRDDGTATFSRGGSTLVGC